MEGDPLQKKSTMISSTDEVPVVEEKEGCASETKIDDDTIVIKDGKRYKKRPQLPSLAELLVHGDKPESEKTPKERFQDFLFGPFLLAVAFCLSFLFWSHVIMKGPRIASPGMDLMDRINNMPTMNEQIERAKKLHTHKQHRNPVGEDL